MMAPSDCLRLAPEVEIFELGGEYFAAWPEGLARLDATGYGLLRWLQAGRHLSDLTQRGDGWVQSAGRFCSQAGALGLIVAAPGPAVKGRGPLEDREEPRLQLLGGFAGSDSLIADPVEGKG